MGRGHVLGCCDSDQDLVHGLLGSPVLRWFHKHLQAGPKRASTFGHATLYARPPARLAACLLASKHFSWQAVGTCWGRTALAILLAVSLACVPTQRLLITCVGLIYVVVCLLAPQLWYPGPVESAASLRTMALRLGAPQGTAVRTALSYRVQHGLFWD